MQTENESTAQHSTAQQSTAIQCEAEQTRESEHKANANRQEGKEKLKAESRREGKRMANGMRGKREGTIPPQKVSHWVIQWAQNSAWLKEMLLVRRSEGQKGTQTAPKTVPHWELQTAVCCVAVWVVW